MANGLWTPSMATGIREIDQDHRHIALLLTLLHEAVCRQRQLTAAKLMLRLRRKVSEHFIAEGRVLSSFGYRVPDSDREGRKAVQERFRNLEEVIQAGDFPMAQRICDALEDQFVRTMIVHVAEYKWFFRDNGIRMAMEMARTGGPQTEPVSEDHDGV